MYKRINITILRNKMYILFQRFNIVIICKHNITKDTAKQFLKVENDYKNSNI